MLQIALHAAAILVGVKRHNKPGWRTCSGGGGEVEVVGVWLTCARKKFWGKFERQKVTSDSGRFRVGRADESPTFV